MSRFAVLTWHVGIGALNWAFVYSVARLTGPAPSAEYFLTDHVMDAWWVQWFWMAPVQLAMGYVGGRLGKVRWWSALVACVGCYMIPVFVEFGRDRTSHNLIPFELAFWALVCGPVALGAVLGHRHAKGAVTRPQGPSHSVKTGP